MKKLILYFIVTLSIVSCDNKVYPDTKLSYRLLKDSQPKAFNGNVAEVIASISNPDDFYLLPSELEWEISEGTFSNGMKSITSKIIDNSSSVKVNVEPICNSYKMIVCYSRKNTNKCESWDFNTTTSFPKSVSVFPDTSVISKDRGMINLDLYYTSGSDKISQGILVTPSAFFQSGNLKAEDIGRFTPLEAQLPDDKSPLRFTYTLNENASQIDSTFQLVVDFDVRDKNNDKVDVKTLFINYKK